MALQGSDTTHPQMLGLIAESIRRKFIPKLRPKLTFNPYLAPGKLEVHAGSKTLRWNLATDIPISGFTSALGETTTTQNEVFTITISSVLMTVADYGAFVKYSDLADSSWTSETREEHAGIFAYAGARLRNLLEYQAADDTTNYVVSRELAANTGTVATTDTMIAQDLAVIAGFFYQGDAEGFDSVGGNFVLFIHGEVEQDLVVDVTTARLSWTPLLQYTEGNANKYMNYKGPGTLLGLAVQRTNEISTVLLTVSTTPGSLSGTVTAYKCIALADHGVGKTTLDQSEPRIIMKKPGTSTVSVPLDTYGTIGFKLRQAQSLLDSTRALSFYAAK